MLYAIIFRNPGLYWTAASILQTLVNYTPKTQNPQAEGKQNSKIIFLS